MIVVNNHQIRLNNKLLKLNKCCRHNLLKILFLFYKKKIMRKEVYQYLVEDWIASQIDLMILE